MPKTKLGKWSAGLFGAFVLVMILFYLLIGGGQTGGDTFFSNWVLAISILLAAACGVGGFIVGLVAIIKKRERNWLVFIAVGIGAFVTFFFAAELLFPH